MYMQHEVYIVITCVFEHDYMYSICVSGRGGGGAVSEGGAHISGV